MKITKHKGGDEIFVFEDLSHQTFPHTTNKECVVVPLTEVENGGLKSKIWENGELKDKPNPQLKAEEKSHRNERTRERRKVRYGAIPKQLDEIFHDIDAWKARITAIKLEEPLED